MAGRRRRRRWLPSLEEKLIMVVGFILNQKQEEKGYVLVFYLTSRVVLFCYSFILFVFLIKKAFATWHIMTGYVT